MRHTIKAFVLGLGLALGAGSLHAEAPALDIPNARNPVEGLVTGGQPTAEQLAEAAQKGFKTVISLLTPAEQGPAEEAAVVEKLGMRFVAIPIAGPQDLTDENAQALAKALGDAAGSPVLLHCASGNRVGALLAIKAFRVDGKTPAEALELGRKAGLTERLEPAVREKLGL